MGPVICILYCVVASNVICLLQSNTSHEVCNMYLCVNLHVYVYSHVLICVDVYVDMRVSVYVYVCTYACM